MLYALADGACDPGKERALREHLADCAACAEEAETIQRLEARIRREFPKEAAPEGLWGRVMEKVAETGQRARPASRRGFSFRWPVPAAAAAFAAVLLAVVGIVTLPIQRDLAPEALIVEPVNDFITYRLSERPLDVESSDPGSVARWFADKIDYDLPLKIPDPAGYRLVGSRLCYFLNRRLSALMYRGDKGVLSLYVMSGARLELPEGQLDGTTGRRISSHQVNDHTNLIWRDGELVYSLVSNLPKAEMLRFIAGLRAAALEWRGRSALAHAPFIETAFQRPG